PGPIALTGRRARGRPRWRRVDSDLGLAMLWTVDGDGRYTARWEVPRDAPKGVYRMVVRAKRYTLRSRSFRVRPARSLRLREVEGGVAIDYPEAVRDVDLTWRPRSASGGTIRYRHGGRTVTLRRRRGTVFPVPAGARVLSARDRFGNLVP
ncbi:MAG: hypothetical protein ACRDL0_17325, partial [Thermoleophilaceae bacterium]